MFTGDRGILKDFPFTDGPAEPKGLSLAVALSMMLTAVVRRTLRTAPMFAIDAYEAQSGKTLLGHLAGAMATGREIAVRPWANGRISAQERSGDGVGSGRRGIAL